MLHWLIVGELAAAVALGGLWTCRHVLGWGGPKTPFAVRWTKDPLPALARPHVKVSKSHFLMTVFDGEKPVKSYRVAVGANPGHKQREGDKRTPEGELTICMRNPDSKYVLSLGLSYPDADDANRGLREGIITRQQHEAIVRASRLAVQPPWDTPLGGEIMIHGARGGRTQTLGCIAVDDDEIRELYLRLPLGTPVTIVP
jgi:hypothetical protein